MSDKRALIIDDEKMFADFVRQVAEGMGYEVRVTDEAEVFKQTYMDFDPTVIILDMVMPGVEGIELVNWLAEEGCSARIMVVTGYNPHYVDFAKTIGSARGLVEVQSYTKPISLADLRKALS
ncbi:response regulator [Sneathiella sp. P13V-1]|uniref:response regulator n=1 Tax=Sneathiella sp. P13V-1 TaxID=2697366 RepID=UPI00187B69F8|nr:response regulator [Sneathiella sp. P13V-1]MBE7636480.1 response regulator [Sneathiella sp. P13V-1]